MPNVLTRREVYDLIDGERDHMGTFESKYGSRSDCVLDDDFDIVEHLIAEARKIEDDASVPDRRAYMRSIAAVAVRSMEERGAPPRLSSDAKP